MPERIGLTFGALPQRAAGRWGQREALVFRDQRWSFRDLANTVDRAAKGFLALGVQPAEKVAIWLLNRPEWIVAAFALAKIGAIHVPINTRFRTDDLAYVLSHSNATTLITHDVSGPVDYLAMIRTLVPDLEALRRNPRNPPPSRAGAAPPLDGAATGDAIHGAPGTAGHRRAPDLRRVILTTDRSHAGAFAWAEVLDAGRHVAGAALAERAAAVSPDDTLFIMFTSGTTGFPKGVMRTHRAILGNQLDRERRLQSTERDVFVNYLPLFHIFGYVDGPLGSMFTGYRQVLTSSFDPDEALDLVEREGGTQVHGFDTHVKALCDTQEARPRDLRTLRTGIFALGMASATATGYRARKVLAPMRHLTAYGMTEIGANVSMSFIEATEEQACETSGVPCEGIEARVIDPDTGRDAPLGVPGELIVRSRWVMQGYYRQPAQTAQAFDAEGWFHTGDMAYLRPDGYLRFIGRYKDMLKVGGENVDPMEVEAHLAHHPAVREVAVIGLPDPRLTEVGVAFVVPVPGTAVTADDLIAACRGRIASFKIPRHVLFVDRLPMTASGKVQKVKLRDDARRALAADLGDGR